MTQQEKDDFEEGEADELINFAENLDYDKFMNDLEFRKGLASLQDRAGKLKKESDAFKDALIADFNALQEDDEERSTSAGDFEETRGSEASTVHAAESLAVKSDTVMAGKIGIT